MNNHTKVWSDTTGVWEKAMVVRFPEKGLLDNMSL